MGEKQLTFSPHGHVLTNANVWSPDGRRIAYDTRSTCDGSIFDGTRIETVDADSREVRILFESKEDACCGVATYSPVENKVIFIHGPERPTRHWKYGPDCRRGVIVDEANPDVAVNLDACDLIPPFTPGALRGGTHVHIFSPDGRWVSFTYNDKWLSRFDRETPANDVDLRNIGVSAIGRPVFVPSTDERHRNRNHDGSAFSVLVTRTTAYPTPGSDEISKACEEAWVGKGGYVRSDGTQQSRALAFQGQVVTRNGATIIEVFIVDLPDDLTIAGDGPLQGTQARRPMPPKGTSQRRLTYTAERKYPGIQGPRHWLRSSPDGGRIGFLMKDDAGVVQFWTVSPNGCGGGEPVQLTRGAWDVASAFTWSPDGKSVALAMDHSVCVVDAVSGVIRRITEPKGVRPEACVFSPDGTKVAFAREIAGCNQIFIADCTG